MNVLIGCEYSGIVREEFAKRGHNSWSCDLLPTDKQGNHFQCDVFKAIEMKKWDLCIFHPPCTYLANSGVRWLYNKDGTINYDREMKMWEAAMFFKELLFQEVPKIAIENPIMHKHGLKIIGQKYNQIIQPWQFGHGESKATCLWLKNLPELKHTKIIEEKKQSVWRMAPSPDRSKKRSKTFKGIAEAMASQWT